METQDDTLQEAEPVPDVSNQEDEYNEAEPPMTAENEEMEFLSKMEYTPADDETYENDEVRDLGSDMLKLQEERQIYNDESDQIPDKNE